VVVEIKYGSGRKKKGYIERKKNPFFFVNYFWKKKEDLSIKKEKR